MKASKIQTRNRNIIDIEELHALNSAYGERIRNKEVMSLIGFPALVLGLLTFLLTYRWWTPLIAIVVGGFWGYKSILPKVIQRRYDYQSLIARNQFLNNLTQIMTNQNRTVLQSIESTISRSRGELQDELKRLTGTLKLGSDQESVRIYLKEFGNKYQEDRILSQYLEQLETLIFEGKRNTDVLHSLCEQHNKMLTKRQEFFDIKDVFLRGVRLLISLMVVLILMFHASSYLLNGDLDMYISGYTHSVMGYLTVPLFLVVFSLTLKAFFDKFFDDSVTELEVRTKK